MKKKWLLGAFVTLLICGCAVEDDSEKKGNSENKEKETELLGTFTYNNNGEISFTDNEFTSDNENVSFEKKVAIKFNGVNDPEVTGLDNDITLEKDKLRGDGKTYLIIRSSVNAEYTVSGNCENGALLIFSEKKFKLVLDNLNLRSNNWPAINIQSGKRCFVELKGENSLIGPGILNLGDNLKNPDYVQGVSDSKDEYLDAKATLFSEGELIFKGEGTLNVTGNYKHAICSDDYVRVLSGKVNVTGAPTDGIHVNDAMYVNGGEISIVASGDGIECDKGFVYVNDGKLTVKSGKVGIKTSEDKYLPSDALHPFILIEKGDIAVTTSGTTGDGITAGSYLAITGGKVVVETAGVSAKGLKSGINDDSTMKCDIVIAKEADVKVTANGNASGAVAVKSAANIYLRGGKLTVCAQGFGSVGVLASENIVISGGENTLYAAGNVLNANEVSFENGADLLAIGSELKVKNVTAKQKYVTGGYPDISIAVGDSYEITAYKKGEFKTALSNLKMLFTYKDLAEKPVIEIDGIDSSANFELKP